MSEFLVIGDPQGQKSNKDKLTKLFEITESHNLPIIWLGDLLEHRGMIQAEILNLYYNYFKKSRLHHYIIVGNHDMLGVSLEGNALESLKSLKNVWVIDIPTFIGKNILAVPYYRDPTKFLESINIISGTPYIFCHQGVKEFTIDSGYTEDEAVNLADLKQFKMVVCGHYHAPKEIDNVVYMGSPFSHSFGESNQEKRIGIFNSETGQMKYIATDFPQHISYDVNLNGQNILIPDDKNYVRVTLKGTREQIDTFDKSKYPKFKFIEEYITQLDKSEIKETLSPFDMYDKWFKDIKKEVNPDLYNLGKKIMGDVK